MNTLLCTGCNQEKPTTDFHKSKKNKTGFQNKCKQCNIEKVKEYYKKKDYKEAYSVRAKRHKDRFIDGINFIKGKSGCCCCPEKDSSCLDFHHVDSEEKDFTVSKLTASKSRKFLLEEVQKCVIVCANCHRKLHAGKIQLDNPQFCVITEDEWNNLVPPSPRKSLPEEEIISRRRARNKSWICIDCGEKCSKDASRCLKCSDLLRTAHIPPLKQLKLEFDKNKNLSELARKYKVAPNTIKSWLNR